MKLYPFGAHVKEREFREREEKARKH
jgi:hypothetical protein